MQNYNDKYLEVLCTSQKHIFLTGKAGTGKTTLVRKFTEEFKENFAVVAPTGVAAINIGGETIHSFFGFKPSTTERDAAKMGKSKKTNRLFNSLHTLVVDEMSMVRADLLDCVNAFLQKARNNNLPFGGVRMIFVGDLYQLPPVVGRDEEDYFNSLYKSPYFFSSRVFKEVLKSSLLEYIELKKIFRQEDKKFKQLLNKIRKNSISSFDLHTLNKQVGAKNYGISLVSTNMLAYQKNEQELNKIKGKLYTFTASIEGDLTEKEYPTEEKLNIKKRSKIMFLTNDPMKRWHNGTLGEVVKIDSVNKILKIKILESGELVKVEPFTWNKYRTVVDQKTTKVKKETAGSFTQFPIKLAWAITIHKSQGKTFSKVNINLGYGAFSHGQTYVALSRCKTLHGISLSKPITPKDIKLDDAVVRFVEYLEIKGNQVL